ncbi:MAG TPA: tetratricopeptide repeat protein [Bacteroidia bacterium]|nr:tetratricopeptide repeat protein [Bacteroidia bacterium]
MGENRVALDILNEAERMEPFYGDIHMTRGSIYGQMGLHEKAITSYTLAGQYDIPEDEVKYWCAYELGNMGRHEEALPLLKKILLKNPDHEAAMSELAFCYEAFADIDDSIRFFTKMTDLRPYNSLAWFNLGVAYSRAADYEKAIGAYDYALLIREDFASAIFNKAHALATLGRHDEAIQLFLETFRYEEQRGDTHYYIGESYEKKEEWDLAMIHYNKAIKLSPDLADGWLGMGLCLEMLGRMQEAIHYVKKAIEIAPDNSEYWYTFGDIQVKLGFQEEAEAAYRKVLEIEPENPDIWLDYSGLQFEMENEDIALETLAEGIKFHPSNAELNYRMSAYLLSLGKKQDALSYLHNALQLDFEKHNTLFEFLPQLKENTGLAEIIESYRK